MRWRRYLLVFCIILVVCTPSMGDLVPVESSVSITVSPEWVIANGIDSTTIIVDVKTFGGEPIPNLSVDFSVPITEQNKGFVHPLTAITNSAGIATTTFRSKTVSGTANVTATIHYLDGEILKSLHKTGIVKIDHDTPYSFQVLSYNNSGSVGSIQEIMIKTQDRHGNTVDSRRNSENTNFLIITKEDSFLWNFSSSCFTNISNTIPNDENGWVIVNISLFTDEGETLVKIKPQSVAEKTITVIRVADGNPWYLDYDQDPQVSFVPATENGSFVITFLLGDEYGNFLNNKQIEIYAESGPSWGPYIATTLYGTAAARYGPFYNDTTKSWEIFSTNLIARAVDNTSLSRTIPVEFYDPRPVSLVMTINPKNLPSLDVNSTSRAVITIAVVDMHGKGVGGETVNLSLQNINTGGFAVNNSTLYPSISATSVTTNPSGYAYVDFIPGEFSSNVLTAATGQCDIIATWNDTTHDIQKIVTPIWKNYAFLSVTTWLEDNTVEKDQEVNVSVSVKADGPGFASRPIDMILCTDRGASMQWDTYDALPSDPIQDKMVYLYQYGHILLNELNEIDDRAGVVSFGPGVDSTNWPNKWPGKDNIDDDDTDYKEDYYPDPSGGTEDYEGYSEWATVNHNLTFNFIPVIDNEIRSLRPFSDPWKENKHNVPLRYGLYTAINDMIGLEESEPRDGAIRAIVVLTDPEWNEWGDPSAGWDGTSVATANAVTNKLPWALPESGVSAWVPFDEFGVGDPAVWEYNVPVSDPRQNMANYAKEHDIIIYTIAYPKKDVNIDTARERIMRQMADSTGGMYFEARNGTSLEGIFETIGKDLREKAIVNTTAVLNFTNVKLNDITVPGNQTFDYIYREDISTVTHKWNITNDLIEYGCRNDTLNWTTDQKLTFDLGTMYRGDLWRANFTLKAKDYGLVELFEGSYVSSEGNPDVIIPPSFLYGGPTIRGDEPTQSLEITYFNVSESLNAVYDIAYSGNKEVQARLYYRKSGDITGNWVQIGKATYRFEDGCLNIHDEKQLNKWMFGSDYYMFKIEAWAVDAPLDEAYDGPKKVGRRFFIWLR